MTTERKPSSLHADANRFRALADNGFDLICEIDARGRVCFASANHGAILGRQARDLVGEPFSEWVAAPDRERAMEMCDATLGSGESSRTTLHLLGRDDRELRVECTVTPFEAEDRSTHALLSSRDITGSKREEERLHASRERFRTIIENAYDMVAEYDMSGNLIYANDRTREVLGYTAEDVRGKPIDAYVHPEDRARTKRVLENIRNGSVERSVVTYRVGTRDGAWCWLEANVCTVAHPEGERRMVVIARDVTRRIDAEHRMRESEERYRQLVESSPVGIVVIQGQAIVFSNRAGAEVFGAAAVDDLIGTNVFDLVDAADADALARQMAQTRKRMPAVDTMEARVHGLDGRVRDVVGTGRAISYRGAPALQGIVRDVTEKRGAAQEQEELELQLQEARKLESLGVLAGGIAHDFNNLLAVILGNVRFARQLVEQGSELDEALRDTTDAGESAARLTRQLLAYAGRRSPDVRPVDLSALVEETSALLGSAVSKRVKLAFELAPNLPTVRADAVQIEQVVMNLVINAAEAIGDRAGTITVATGQIEVSRSEIRNWVGGENLDAGAYAYLEARDSGKGMDAATRERIFDPFFTTKAQGHGLGLSAALGLVRGHDGAISVETAPARGTRLRVHLPISSEARARRAEPDALASEWNVAVLVAGDERDSGGSAARLLRERGAEAVEVSGGAEAIDRVRMDDGEIAAALIDLDPEAPSGVDLALELRVLRPDLPLLLVSGSDHAALARRLANDAPTQFLVKPYRDETLVEHLRALLGKDLAVDPES